ncbi:hypothetical protein ACQ0QQ_02070 [Lysinibacillus sphaericus]
MAFLIIPIATIPFLIYVFALMDQHRHYRVLLRYALLSAGTWAAIFAVTLIVNLHYLEKYSFPLFPTGSEIKIMLLVCGLLFGIVFLVIVLMGLFSKKLIKTIVQSSPLFIVMGLLCLSILMIFVFVLPVSEKATYASAMKRADRSFDEMEDKIDQPIGMTLAFSQQICYGRSSSCRGTEYSNLVFMKNFEDRDLLVQVQMAFYDSSGNVMETIETGTIRIGANEAIPFLPESEVQSGKSPWNRFTLDTDSRTSDIQYRYRYKGTDE